MRIFRLILIIVSIFFSSTLLAQQRYELRGVVLSVEKSEPVGQAVVELPKLGLWAVADSKGEFIISGVPRGEQQLSVQCLGYVTLESVVLVPTSEPLELKLKEDNLKIDDVVVVAESDQNALATSRTINRNALDHLQIVNASDISSLLPGGKSVNPDLTVDNTISLRSAGSSEGNAAFGTAIEVDGVRLSTNSSMGELAGASTRNLSSTNIERVEVVTGVPSAEYGDISSGMVRISTRKGVTPWTATLSTNPRTKQISLSKGFGLGRDRGVINSSVEYTRATKNPVSPYTTYQRTNLSLNYSNTFNRVWRFSAGLNMGLGGMNSKDDPDVFKGEWERARDNAIRFNTSLLWLLNKSWITDVRFDASVSYEDDLSRKRSYVSNSSRLPAVHSELEGYYFATLLPELHHPIQYIDSKELNYEASIKAKWVRSWNDGKSLSNLRVGLAWRSEGNVGEGEYYAEPELAPHGYRPYPYTNIPYLHNLAFWLEENLTLPIGSTTMTLMAGLRGEKSFIKGSLYNNTLTWSPRFNARWRLADWITIRGGWGLVEKLPSLGVLFPRPEYTDIRVFDLSWSTGSSYVYYTRPYTTEYNPELKWQRNRNAELGLDLKAGGFDISIAGFFNRTQNPYELALEYIPISYDRYGLPDGYTIPINPLLKLDWQTGELFVRDADNMAEGWIAMQNLGTNKSFTRRKYQRNGSPVDRMGVELVARFPEIKPIRTEFILDAAYGFTEYVREGLSWYHPSVSSTEQSGNSYKYVGIYAGNNGSTTTTYNGMRSHTLDMNLTATTRIPSLRMVITLRLEGSLVKRSNRLSSYQGKEYAYNVDESGNPTGGSIYDGESYTAIAPIYYMDSAGEIHPFTEQEAQNPDFAPLILRSGNIYQYNQDGYDPYFSANLSITKEIGDIASISFYANNFTNSRKYVSSYATGTRVIFTPSFYYGITLRLKF